MNTQVETKERDAILVEDAAGIRVMGQPVLEALPSSRAPYAQLDPFILVHEGRGRISPDFANKGGAAFGANRRRATAAQLVVTGPGEAFTVSDAAPGTRYLLMAGQPYGEVPRFNGAVRGLGKGSIDCPAGMVT